MPLARFKQKYTVADYAGWPDNERWELIDGIAYDMSPAPAVAHQKMIANLSFVLKRELKGKTCVSFIAPTDVILSDEDVVQPDVFVVCDPRIITPKNIQGAPDLVFEVLDPSTSKKDRWDKRLLYEKYGVKEYVLVDPDGAYVERYVLLDTGKFNKSEVLDWQDSLRLTSLPGIEIPLWELFEKELPPAEG